jgi:Uma2 family endonuclease
MATEPVASGLTYDDLQRFPDDNLRREIIDGELFVTPAPSTSHQQVVAFLVLELGLYARAHGGKVFPAPTDVFFADDSVVEPDVLFVAPEHADRVEKKFVRSAPDIVVEVSSPSTRRLELVRKRALYEREGVPEYWYVDLEAERVEVHRLEAGAYPPPVLLGRRDSLESPLLPGWGVMVEDLLGPSGD